MILPVIKDMGQKNICARCIRWALVRFTERHLSNQLSGKNQIGNARIKVTGQLV